MLGYIFLILSSAIFPPVLLFSKTSWVKSLVCFCRDHTGPRRAEGTARGSPARAVLTGERAVLQLRLLSPLSLSVGWTVTFLLFFHIITYRNHSANQSVAFNRNMHTLTLYISNIYTKYIPNPNIFVSVSASIYRNKGEQPRGRVLFPTGSFWPSRAICCFKYI